MALATSAFVGVNAGLTHNPQARFLFDGEEPSSFVRPRLPDLLPVYDGPFDRIPLEDAYLFIT